MACHAATEYFAHLSASQAEEEEFERVLAPLLSDLKESQFEGAASDAVHFLDDIGDGSRPPEQLAWKKNVCVHCKGGSIREIFDTESPIIDACFAWFEPPSLQTTAKKDSPDLDEQRRLFGLFAKAKAAPWSDHQVDPDNAWSLRKDGHVGMLRGICIATRDAVTVKIQETGQTYTCELPFAVRRIFATLKGLLVEQLDGRGIFIIDDAFSVWTGVEFTPNSRSKVVELVFVGNSPLEPKVMVTYDADSQSISVWEYKLVETSESFPPPTLKFDEEAEEMRNSSVFLPKIKQPRKSSVQLATVIEDASLFSGEIPIEVPIDMDHEVPYRQQSMMQTTPVESCHVECLLKWTSAPCSVESTPSKCVLFDSRPGTAMLALHDADRQQALLFDLTQSATENVLPRTIVAAEQITSAFITRANVKDLIATEGTRFTCYAAEGRRVNIAVDDAHRTLYPQNRLAQRCLATLAQSIPVEDWRRVYDAYLEYAIAERPTKQQEPALLLRILMLAAGSSADNKMPVESDWDRLQSERDSRKKGQQIFTHSEIRAESTSIPPLQPDSASQAMISLHRLLEDMQFSVLLWPEMPILQQTVADLATILGRRRWIEYYKRLGFSSDFKKRHDLSEDGEEEPLSVRVLLMQTLLGRETVLPNPQQNPKPNDWNNPEHFQLSGQLCRWFTKLALCRHQSRSEAQTTLQNIVEDVHSAGWTRQDITNLSHGPRIILLEVLRSCVANPPDNCPPTLYNLLGRNDIAIQQSAFEILPYTNFDSKRQTIDECCEDSENEPTRHEQPVQENFLFDDRRLQEVTRMLSWTKEVNLDVSDGAHEPEPPTATAQQAIATRTAVRTLSLPAGAALLNYQSTVAPEKDSHTVAEINLSVKLLPFNIVVGDDSNAITSDQRSWPDFHAGAATALSQQWRTEQRPIAGFELSFNRPSDLTPRSAGYLLGLGVTGHLRSMVVFQAFSYLDPKNEAVSVGVLLGLSAAFCGTGDARVTSLLGVHLAALLPQKSAELNITLAVQASALLGLGLLYLGTAKRSMAELMVKELSEIRLTHSEEAESCREAYALAAGFAFGMNMLGKGAKETANTSDAALVRQLENCIDSDGQHPLPGMHKASRSGINVAVTSPAATVALSLMFLATNRRDISQMLPMPEATTQLDYIRPDLIMLRVIGRSLISLQRVQPSKKWVTSNMPCFLATAYEDDKSGRQTFSTDHFRAYWSVVTGACYVIALKFAGSADAAVHACLLAFHDELSKAVKSHSTSHLKRYAQSNGLSIILLSLSIVFAGTGELEILRRLRLVHGRLGEHIRHSTHFATSQALGLLFLGKGRCTLSNSPAGIAIILCSFYPAFPGEPADNRAHLQAARHLWPLAIETRCLQIRDADTGKAVPMLANVYLHEEENVEGRLVKLPITTPSLLPRMQSIHSIKVDSVRYWPVKVTLEDNPSQLEAFLRHQTIFVKKHTGRLDYASDPKGLRGFLGTSGGNATISAVHDFDKTALIPSASGQMPMTTEESDQIYRAFTQAVAAECLQADKSEAESSYHSLFLDARYPVDVLTAQSVTFATTFYSARIWRDLFIGQDDLPSARLPLIERSFIESLEYDVYARLDVSLVDYLRDLPEDITHQQAVSLAILCCPPTSILRQLRKLCQDAAKVAGKERKNAEDTKTGLSLVLQQTLGQLAACGDKPMRIRTLANLCRQAWLS